MSSVPHPDRSYLDAPTLSGRIPFSEKLNPRTVRVLAEGDPDFDRFIVEVSGPPQPYDDVLSILNNKESKLLIKNGGTVTKEEQWVPHVFVDAVDESTQYKYSYRAGLIQYIVDGYQRFVEGDPKFDVDEFLNCIPRHLFLRERMTVLFRQCQKPFNVMLETKRLQSLTRQRLKTSSIANSKLSEKVRRFFNDTSLK